MAIVTHASVAVALTGLLAMEGTDMLSESKTVEGGMVGKSLMGALDRMDSARTAGAFASHSSCSPRIPWGQASSPPAPSAEPTGPAQSISNPKHLNTGSYNPNATRHNRQ